VAVDTASVDSIDVRIVLPDGRSLSGTVPGVVADVVRTVTYSRVRAKHRLAAWVRLLALTAAYPQRPFEAATVGRSTGSSPATIVRIPPLAADEAGRRALALGHLTTLLDLYDRGMREPLPLYCASSAAYAEAARADKNPVTAGREPWKSSWNYDNEDREAEHQLVLGGERTFDEVLAEVPRADEEGDGWDVTEATRFGRLSLRLWDGLLASET
jgi:exodeoxyribonuclease V gamma subunit